MTTWENPVKNEKTGFGGDSEKNTPNVGVHYFLKRERNYRARHDEMLAVFGHEIFGARGLE
jgi:hypothetical protein